MVIFFIFIANYSLSAMEISSDQLKKFPIDNLPRDIQNIIFSYLPFRNVESDEKLKEILKEKGKSEDNEIEGKRFIVRLGQSYQQLLLRKKNRCFSWEKELISTEPQNKKSFLEKIPLVATIACWFKNDNYADLYDDSGLVTIGKFVVSPGFRYVAALQTKRTISSGPNYKLHKNVEGFYIIDLKTRQKDLYLIPQEFDLETKYTTDKQEAITLINQGYYYNNLFELYDPRTTEYGLEKHVEDFAIASDGKTLAYTDNHKIYLLEINKENKLTRKELKDIGTTKIDNFDGFIHQPVMVEALEFNRQKTKLGILFTEKGREKFGTDIELICIEPEPVKTITNYIKSLY
jgi:hypothetical protein